MTLIRIDSLDDPRVAEGSSRHDLYFRLVTFEIELPPLRQRREDIPLLVEHFLEILAGAGPRPAISPEALAELCRRDWHGNVRELRNAIEHALILARGRTIAPEHLPPPMMPAGAGPPALGDEQALAILVRRWAQTQLAAADPSPDLYQRLLKLVEPPLLESALRHYDGQCLAAARRLGLHRTTLRKKLDALGIGGDE